MVVDEMISLNDCRWNYCRWNDCR